MDGITEDSAVDRVWDAIETHLLAVKQAAVREIRNYPQPIAGCDAQIPALWERRDGAVAELERLAAARQAPAGRAGDAIDEFVTSSKFIDDEKKHEFLALAIHS